MSNKPLNNQNKSSTLLNIMQIVLIVASLLLPPVGNYAQAADLVGKDIMIVMSYHSEYPWHQETRQGIELILKGANIKYFYLDTKNNLAGGQAKAEEAFRLYQQFKPDAVIAAEDNAQSMFVVPFLKEKVKIPVVFCGVNNDASKYGYPAANVTGIIEKKHYHESISLTQLIVPGIKKVAVIYRDTPSNQTNISQLKAESASYKAEISSFLRVETLEDMKIGLAALAQEIDALIVLNLTGITDIIGNKLEAAEVISHLTETWQKPTIGVSSWEIKAGLLCAVAKTGQDQGMTAGRMVIDLLAGKSISSVPITHNKNGRRVINVSTAKKLGIKLKPIALINAELVK